ncbi:MAG: cytochrome c [Bacteroidetes bacterium]|nr:cytochrome c [Bacteroidota bacterium]
MKTTLKKSGIILIGLVLSGITLEINHTFTQTVTKPKCKPWLVPEVEGTKKNPVKAGDEIDLRTGRTLWIQYCKSCHGLTGKGDGPKTGELETLCPDFSAKEFQSQTDGELFWKVTEGRKPMPSHKQKLTDDERWAVVSYTRTFRGAEIVK